MLTVTDPNIVQHLDAILPTDKVFKNNVAIISSSLLDNIAQSGPCLRADAIVDGVTTRNISVIFSATKLNERINGGVVVATKHLLSPPSGFQNENSR